MWSRIVWVGFALAGCGDNLPCDVPVTPKPTGLYSDPYTFPLPDDCIPRGMTAATGRWFVRSGTTPFDYEYPEIDGNCSAGFRLADTTDSSEVDPDYRIDDQTWTDGTLLLRRYSFSSTFSAETDAQAYCMQANGQLAMSALYEDPNQQLSGLYTGGRFSLDSRAQGLQLVGEQGAGYSAYDLSVAGDVAYLVGPGGSAGVDIHDPTSPQALWMLAIPANDIALVQTDDATIVYLADLNDNLITIVDVTTPNAPVVIGHIAEYAHTLELVGSELYLGNYTERIPVYDVTDPRAPVFERATVVPGPPSGVHDLFVDGTRIFANYTTAGLVVFDTATDFEHPVEVGSVATSYSHTNVVGTAGGRRLELHGDEGMTPDAGGAFLRILDADPSSPTFLSELARYQANPDVSIHNFELVGDRLYIAYYQAGVRVVDLSDPTHPREVAHYNTWDGTSYGAPFEGALSVQVVGDLIYVADSQRGLVILRDPVLALQ